MPVIHGPEKGVRAIRREVRRFPFLEQLLDRLQVPLSVVPGNILYHPPSILQMSGLGTQSGTPRFRLGQCRIDISPTRCAEMDAGEPAAAILSALSAEVASLVQPYASQELCDEAIGLVQKDGQAVLAEIRRAAGTNKHLAHWLSIREPDFKNRPVKMRHSIELYAPTTAAYLRDELREGTFPDSAPVLKALFKAAPESPAPDVWPAYWMTAFELAYKSEKDDAAPASVQQLGNATREWIVRVCVAAHMPYMGEMLSDDTRWTLSRRLLESGVTGVGERAEYLAERFALFREMLEAQPVAESERFRRSLAHAYHLPNSAQESLRSLRSDVYSFTSDAAQVEAGKMAEPLFDRLVNHFGGSREAFAVVRHACLHMIHVMALTKTCNPASEAQRADLARFVGENPHLGAILAEMTQIRRPGGEAGRTIAASNATRSALWQAAHTYNWLSQLLDTAWDNDGESRTQAFTQTRDALTQLGDMQWAGPRKPIDLFHQVVDNRVSAPFVHPASWPSIADQEWDVINQYGRSGDGLAFAALAPMLAAGLARRKEVAMEAALPADQADALAAIAIANSRINTALDRPSSDVARFASTVDDIRLIDEQTAVLPGPQGQAIRQNMVANLATDFGARDERGYRTHETVRDFSDGEIETARFVLTWLNQASAEMNAGNELERLNDARNGIVAGIRIAYERQAAAETGEPGVIAGPRH